MAMYDPEHPDSTREDAWLRASAGALMHAHLAGRILPAHLADIPDRMLVDRLARMDAKELLATLQEIYDIKGWDKPAFERAFIRGALEGWRRGSLVQVRPEGLRVVSTICPVSANVEGDQRICDACRAIQKHAAYLALIGQVEDVEFARLIARGDSVCEMRVKFRAPQEARP